MAEARPLILVPSYNTGRILRETVAGVLGAGVPVWVVVDGSTDGSPALLDEFRYEAHPDFRVILLEKNQGKGAAILHALERAIDVGFTHVLTMDSDGQHPAAMIPEFLKLSAAHPEAAVFGKPIFDASAPALRVNGRKVSNFWANLETLWWGIGDSLFGMRLYPADKLRAVMKATTFARRFDFEPEVAVWLSWFRVPVIILPTPVAESNFCNSFERRKRLTTLASLKCGEKFCSNQSSVLVSFSKSNATWRKSGFIRFPISRSKHCVSDLLAALRHVITLPSIALPTATMLRSKYSRGLSTTPGTVNHDSQIASK